MSSIMSLWRMSTGSRILASQSLWSLPNIKQIRPISSTIARLDSASPAEKQDKIIQILSEKFEPSDLQVQDISGMYKLVTLQVPGGCGSFFAIMLKSKAFDGKSTIQAHIMVNKEIKDVIQDIHGLQVCVRVYMDLCLLNFLTCCDVA